MNMDLYNHGTLGVASDGRGNVGALRGLGSFANHRSKNMAFLFPDTLQTQNSSKDNTAQGKSKHC